MRAMDEPITTEEAAQYASEVLKGTVSREKVREALATGAMQGNNMGSAAGGWRTNRRNVEAWALRLAAGVPSGEGKAEEEAT